MKNLHVFVLALLLSVAGLSICYYKNSKLNLPLTQEAHSPVWTVEAHVSYKAVKKSTKVKLMLPPKQPLGFDILDENFISGHHGLAVEKQNTQRVAQWALRRPKGKQNLYYRIQLVPTTQPRNDNSPVSFPKKKLFSGLMQTAVESVLSDVRSKSADIKSFTHELLVKLNTKDPSDTVKLLKKGTSHPVAWVQRVIDILQGARIPARQVNILRLKDNLTHGQLTPWLEVHNGTSWLPFDPYSARQGYPKNTLIWSIGTTPTLTVKNGKHQKVDFSAYQQFQDNSMIALQKAQDNHSWALEFSLFNLPIQTQNVYRVLLMIPLGCVLMVLFRNVIGIKSFGTFMPILIALAFRETQLVWGIALFTLIIALGLLIRFYLEYLHLLLVPRLASVLIIVIILMLIISLFSHKLGLERVLSIALFPMVILAMTIERMSLVWEEKGPMDALQQCAGTLFLASCAYYIMNSSDLQYLIFVFPELLLVLLAITLVLGRYTGYRLIELWRFRALLKPSE